MLMEFSIIPVGKKGPMTDEIATLVPLMDASGLKYQMNAMSTVAEGDWDALNTLAKKCHQEVRNKHPRVVTTIRIDDEANAEGELAGNVKAVADVLQRD